MSTVTTTNTTTSSIMLDQQDAMRTWIISKMPTSIQTYIDGVNRPWDRTEVLLANIKKLGFNDILLRYEYDSYAEESVYRPYFRLSTLAKTLGHSDPKALMKRGGILDDCTKYRVKSEGGISHLVPGEGGCVIPDHLILSSDTNKYNYIYIDIEACESLVTSAMRQSKFKENAALFKTLLTDLNRVSTVLINKLNTIIAEYRTHEMSNKLVAYEATKKAQEDAAAELEAKEKKLKEETHLLAIATYPDIELEKSHYGYIFSSPDYMKRNLYKIGITDDLKNRERAAHTYCPTGTFLYTVETYDAKSTESILHRALKKHRLQFKINSGDEWFTIPSLDEAKRLLDIVTNNTNNLYEHVNTYLSTLRNTFSIADRPPIPMITNGAEPYVPVKEFIEDVVTQLKALNISSISKTNMSHLLRKTSSQNKYKTHRPKLPIDLDAFIQSSITGLTLNKKTSGNKTSLSIVIETNGS